MVGSLAGCYARAARGHAAAATLTPHTLPLVSHDQSLIGKHPVTRCQHVLWVELRLRCLDDLPGRPVMPFPIVLRHRDRARRHAVAPHIARPFIERAIERG